MADDDGLLCVQGLQHCFTVTDWETIGATSHWAAELLCPTCGTTVTRAVGSDPWRWNPPEDDQG